MHQESWKYRGKLKNHLIQLSHDFKNGSLSLTLNGSLLINGEIQSEEKEKILQFFIDEELFEVKVIREPQKFLYQFIPHTYSTSTTGKTRKKAAKRELISVNTGVIVIAVLMLTIGIYFAFFSYKAAPPLSLGGVIAEAEITEIKAKEKSYLKGADGKTKALLGNIRYKFKVLEEWYEGDASLFQKIGHFYFTKSGLPIQTGDIFKVLYDAEDPTTNTLLLDRPNEEKVEAYKLMARSACVKNLPDFVRPESDLYYCDCVKVHLFQQYGIEGLVRLMHQDKSPTRFQTYNSESYEAFMKEEQQEAIQKKMSRNYGGVLVAENHKYFFSHLTVQRFLSLSRQKIWKSYST